jgi:hypothetical protein
MSDFFSARGVRAARFSAAADAAAVASSRN